EAAAQLVALSADGKVLAAWDARKTLQAWSLETRKARTVARDAGDVVAVALSPDGVLLAAADRERMVRVWKVGADHPPVTLAGHKEEPRALVFDPAGRRLAAAGPTEVRVWEVGGQALAVLAGGAPAAFRPDGQALVTSSPGPGEEAILWDVRG